MRQKPSSPAWRRGTRLSSTVQHRDASCDQHNAYRCPDWLPEPGTAAYADAKTTAFVGDVENSTIRFQHRVARDTEALTLTLTLTLRPASDQQPGQ